MGALNARHLDGYGGGLANGLANGMGGLGGLGGMGGGMGGMGGGMAEYQHLANAGMLGEQGLLNGMGLNIGNRWSGEWCFCCLALLARLCMNCPVPVSALL